MRTGTRTARQTERREQAVVVRWARLNRDVYPELTWLFAIPNGGRREAREAQLLKAEGVTPGVADLCLLWSNGTHPCLWIEMKSATGSLRPEQRAFRQWALDQGHLATVAYSAEEAIATIRRYIGRENIGEFSGHSVMAVDHDRAVGGR